MWRLLEFSEKILSLEKTLSLDPLEFSDNRWKKKPLLRGFHVLAYLILIKGFFNCKFFKVGMNDFVSEPKHQNSRSQVSESEPNLMLGSLGLGI